MAAVEAVVAGRRNMNIDKDDLAVLAYQRIMRTVGKRPRAPAAEVEEAYCIIAKDLGLKSAKVAYDAAREGYYLLQRAMGKAEPCPLLFKS